MHNQTNYQYLKTSILPSHILYVSLTFVLLYFIDVGAAQAAHIVRSPDGNVALTFDVKDLGKQNNCLVYSVAYKSRPIVVDSGLGLALKDAPALDTGFNIISVTSSSNNNIYSPVYGERETIRDHYNQLVVELKESNRPHRRLRLTFRAYNEGGAFCYTLPEQNSLKRFTISAEKTQFRFTDDHTA